MIAKETEPCGHKIVGIVCPRKQQKLCDKQRDSQRQRETHCATVVDVMCVVLHVNQPL